MKMILLFSHKLTIKQENDAKDLYHIKEFIVLPKYLQDLWSNMPVEKSSIKEELEEIKKFILDNSVKNDVVLIQGDFGAVYHMVRFCKELKLKTVYSTTKRNIKEVFEKNKTIKTSTFEHRRFREYE